LDIKTQQQFKFTKFADLPIDSTKIKISLKSSNIDQDLLKKLNSLKPAPKDTGDNVTRSEFVAS